MKRVCYFCKQFSMDFEGDYSEVTPGLGWSMRCELNVWRPFYGAGGTEKDFAAALETAETCGQLEERKP